jgi:hypothetical protein
MARSGSARPQTGPQPWGDQDGTGPLAAADPVMTPLVARGAARPRPAGSTSGSMRDPVRCKTSQIKLVVGNLSTLSGELISRHNWLY